MFDRGIEKLFNFREGDDLVELAINLRLSHAEYRAIEINVFPTGELGVKACADFQQRTDTPVDHGDSSSWRSNARQYLQQRALACAVEPDDTDHFTTLDFERDILERPDISVSILRNVFE